MNELQRVLEEMIKLTEERRKNASKTVQEHARADSTFSSYVEGKKDAYEYMLERLNVLKQLANKDAKNQKKVD